MIAYSWISTCYKALVNVKFTERNIIRIQNLNVTVCLIFIVLIFPYKSKHNTYNISKNLVVLSSLLRMR